VIFESITPHPEQTFGLESLVGAPWYLIKEQDTTDLDDGYELRVSGPCPAIVKLDKSHGASEDDLENGIIKPTTGPGAWVFNRWV